MITLEQQDKYNVKITINGKHIVVTDEHTQAYTDERRLPGDTLLNIISNVLHKAQYPYFVKTNTQVWKYCGDSTDTLCVFIDTDNVLVITLNNDVNESYSIPLILVEGDPEDLLKLDTFN